MSILGAAEAGGSNVPRMATFRNAAPYWLSLPALVLFGILLLVPIGMTILLSFYEYSWGTGVIYEFTFENYFEIFTDGYFYEIFLRTFGIALVTTLICILIGVPEAYILFNMEPRWRAPCLLIVLGPLLISVVVRTLGWTILLGANGIVNDLLMTLGIVGTPVELLFTKTGVVIALVHVLAPYMVLAVWTSLQRIDPAVVKAAISLGATQAGAFRRVVLPQLMPGILSGTVIVFSLAVSAFATPALIGGRRVKVVATTVLDEFLSTLNWPLGAAIALLLLLITGLIVFLGGSFVEKRYSQVFQ